MKQKNKEMTKKYSYSALIEIHGPLFNGPLIVVNMDNKGSKNTMYINSSHLQKKK